MNADVKVKIGWYCPFVIPALLGNDSIEAYGIDWQDSGNYIFGSLKLCRKLTAVIEALQMNKLSGIVMTNCCNISHAVFEYLRNTNRDFWIYLLHIPHKNNSHFSLLLNKQWGAIKSSLENYTQNRPLALTHIYKSDLVEVRRNGINMKNGWCLLSENVEFDMNKPYENAQILLNKVVCPRIFEENDRTKEEVTKTSKTNFIGDADGNCIIQKYCTLISGYDSVSPEIQS